MRDKQVDKSLSSDSPGENDGEIEGQKSSDSDASDSDIEDTDSDSKDTTQGQKQPTNGLADAFDSMSFIPYSQRPQQAPSDDRTGDECADHDHTNNAPKVEEHVEDENIYEDGDTKRPEN